MLSASNSPTPVVETPAGVTETPIEAERSPSVALTTVSPLADGLDTDVIDDGHGSIG